MTTREFKSKNEQLMRLKVVKVKAGGWAIEASQRISGKWKIIGHQGGYASEGAASSALCKMLRDEVLP